MWLLVCELGCGLYWLDYLWSCVAWIDCGWVCVADLLFVCLVIGCLWLVFFWLVIVLLWIVAYCMYGFIRLISWLATLEFWFGCFLRWLFGLVCYCLLVWFELVILLFGFVRLVVCGWCFATVSVSYFQLCFDWCRIRLCFVFVCLWMIVWFWVAIV